MGMETIKRPLLLKGGQRIPTTAIQTILSSGISSSSTDAALTAVAADTEVALVRTQGSGAGWECKLSTGRPVGTSVTVAVACDSTAPFTLLLESTTQSFYGSTFNALTWSTDSSGTAATLTKVSTATYVYVADKAVVTAAGSTGTV